MEGVPREERKRERRGGARHLILLVFSTLFPGSKWASGLLKVLENSTLLAGITGSNDSDE